VIRPVRWAGERLVLLDQQRLPGAEVEREYQRWEDVADAIRTLVVRGAPAIGVTAAMGVALAAAAAPDSAPAFARALEEACRELAATRPTAVNLFWGIERMRRVAHEAEAGRLPVPEVRRRLVQEALQIALEDEAACRRIGEQGAALFGPGDGVLTHCNAGALACVDYGTALAPLRAAHARGVRLHVYVDETRPFLQGSRLTAWELLRAGIPCTLITDNMAAHFMARGAVQKVIVGADRIAANGDVANKIGTYGLAVLAAAHGIPFYVAAPRSTVDLQTASGAAIPIEERDPEEVTHVRGVRVAPEGMPAAHPAFDVTPARFVTAIVTEEGVHRPPFEESLRSASQARAA
jgi:methylthioribose-1-phosphate isomerase